MSSLRALLVWLVALALLLAAPAASLAECLRCPPDCPMHLRRATLADLADDEAPEHGAHHAAHAPSHGDEHGEHRDCHRDAKAAPRPDDGPCISGACGHLDRSLVRVLPDAVLVRPRTLVPVVAEAALVTAAVRSVTRAADEPPTEPPRALPS